MLNAGTGKTVAGDMTEGDITAGGMAQQQQQEAEEEADVANKCGLLLCELDGEGPCSPPCGVKLRLSVDAAAEAAQA